MSVKNKIRFKTEIVNGVCPTCEEQSILVSLACDHYRCTTCGSDLEQKVNGVISYIHVINMSHEDKPEV